MKINIIIALFVALSLFSLGYFMGKYYEVKKNIPKRSEVKELKTPINPQWKDFYCTGNINNTANNV